MTAQRAGRARSCCTPGLVVGPPSPPSPRGAPAASPRAGLQKAGYAWTQTQESALAMASGGRLPSQPSAPRVRSEPRLGEAALGVPLPQPWWNPWLSGPSPGGPRAACPFLGVAPGPQLLRPPLQAATPRVPCDWRGPLDERRLVAHLQLALGREARLWRGGQPQVGGPTAGASRDHVHPLTRARARGTRPGSTCARTQVSSTLEAETFTRCVPCTRHEAAVAEPISQRGRLSGRCFERGPELENLLGPTRARGPSQSVSH